MKKISVSKVFTLSAILLAMPSLASAQYWDPTTGGIYYNGGKVGIGTTAPNGNLHISDGNSVSSSLVTSDYAIISVQNSAPGLSIISAGYQSGQRAVFKGVRARGSLASPSVPYSGDDVLSILGAIYDGSNTEATAGISFKVDGSVSNDIAPQRISFVTSATNGAARQERVVIKSDGNVGIGTTNPGSYKLAVVGKIRAYEVVVETSWPDYVFADDYELTPLDEVATFIKANKHLPGVPSASDVEKKGISLGENQAILLRKIEELTLYMIDMKKENEELKARMATLEKGQ
ncbi:hypothetical protein ES708_14875 [subsurface metagenome]